MVTRPDNGCAARPPKVIVSPISGVDSRTGQFIRRTKSSAHFLATSSFVLNTASGSMLTSHNSGVTSGARAAVVDPSVWTYRALRVRKTVTVSPMNSEATSPSQKNSLRGMGCISA